jgi:hypothetical protein
MQITVDVGRQSVKDAAGRNALSMGLRFVRSLVLSTLVATLATQRQVGYYLPCADS